MYTKFQATDQYQPDMVDERAAVAGVRVTYLGFAREGTQSTAETTWRIIRFTETTDASDNVVTKREFPDGSVNFNKTWDERATYNYKFRY